MRKESYVRSYLNEGRLNPKEIKLLKEAITHLNKTVEIFSKLDRMITTDDYKYYRFQIEQLLSSDHGEAGLMAMLDNIIETSY